MTQYRDRDCENAFITSYQLLLIELFIASGVKSESPLAFVPLKMTHMGVMKADHVFQIVNCFGVCNDIRVINYVMR